MSQDDRQEPGKPITARFLNQRADALLQGDAGSSSPPLGAMHHPGGYNPRLGLFAPFLATLSGASSPYSFTEAIPKPGHTTVSGRTGTSNAYEVNAVSGLSGKKVWLFAAAPGEYVFQYYRDNPPSICPEGCEGPFPDTLTLTDSGGSCTLTSVNYYLIPNSGGGAGDCVVTSPPTQRLLTSPLSTVDQSWVGCHTVTGNGASALGDCGTPSSESIPVYYNLKYSGCNASGANFGLTWFAPNIGCQAPTFPFPTSCLATYLALTCAGFPWSNANGNATTNCPGTFGTSLYVSSTTVCGSTTFVLADCSTLALSWQVKNTCASLTGHQICGGGLLTQDSFVSVA